jgi:DNA-binding transcriptional regulator YhcF (GntR family)
VARWDVAIAIDRHEGLPIFSQIARAISDDVRRGRLLRRGKPSHGPVAA